MHEADPYAENTNPQGQHHDDDPHDHPAPFAALVGVFVALLFLTVVTVAVRYVDLGEFNLMLAMAIATLKGGLVVAIFMHLWWDSRFNTVSLIAAFAFVALFIALSILDSGQYKPQQDDYRAQFPLQEMHLPEPAVEGDAPAAEAAH